MAPTGGQPSGNIKVVVRVRPFNSRELDRNAKCIVQMKGEQTILQPPPEAADRLRQAKGGLDGQRRFKYDKSYWSFDKSDPHFAGQDNLFDDLGSPLLDNAFQGYNNCIFAYGQTGSGKSYSMMGYGAEAGVIPQICRDMFERITSLQSDPNLTCTVEVSYLEIYNERVRDLLNPVTKGNLRVREHPSTGPYVEDLAKLAVRSFSEIENLMDEGNKARTVAATNMNETSSRSHAVFTLTLTQKRHDVETRMDAEKVAKISLVDLAGSERATSTGATGARLKEGAEINRSLSTLGRVIAALADLSSGKKGMKVPYRDSVLTWLLKDSLGGNSLTAMIAAISPADINFEETLSTLRYADSAKRIKNHAVVNEDPNARMIRELKEELAQLRSKLGGGGIGIASEDTYPPGTPLDQQMVSITQADGSVKRVSKAEIREQLSQSEKLYKDLNQTWEEKLQMTEEIHKEREAALEELGISIEHGNVGLSTPKKMPHLVNLNDDPLLAECLVYNLKPGTTTVGNVEAETAAEIRLNGSKIMDQHCKLDNVDNVVTLIPSEGVAVMVNGIRVDEPKRLKSGNRIILGDFHIFRFNNPLEAKAERGAQSLLRHSVTASQFNTPTRPGHDRSISIVGSEIDGSSSRADSPMFRGRDSDWSFARREAASAMLGTDQKITSMTDDELDHLFENVQKAREERRGRPESRFFDHDDDSDDLSSFLVRDKYMSNGTIDNFSLDTALTMPNTPLQEHDASPDENDLTLKIAQGDMQNQLDARKEDEEAEVKAKEAVAAERAELDRRKAEMEETIASARRDFEQQLKKQKDAYEAQIKRVTLKSRPKTGPSGYTELTMAELATARSAVERWQQRNFINIAELVLQHAGALKEAQVMSKIMDKNVYFQFAILDSGADRASSYDLILHDISSDEDEALAAARKPCLGVRVIDEKLSVVHLWSLEKLRLRLTNMRRMHQYIDQPEYLQHFRLENPFSESYQPLFSLVGEGSIPLTAVYETRVQDFNVEVVSPYTQNVIGKLRLSLEPSLAEAPPSTIKFNIVIRDMTGFAEHEGTNIHAQFFVSGASDEEGVATTHTIAGFGDGSIRFESIHSLSMMESNARNSFLKVSIYAQVTSMHLDKLTSWDEIRESAEKPAGAQITPRLPESEYQLEERHDIFAKIQVLELAENGQYLPVEVVQASEEDEGVYQLHQGLQRRIMVSMTHSLTESLPWDDLKNLRVGDVHLIDSSGRIADLDSVSSDVKLKQTQEPMIRDNADGTSNITIVGQWDTSLHKSLLLDRATAAQCRIRFSVRWDIVSNRLEQPISFAIQQHLQILPRSYLRPQNILKAFWNQTRVTHSTDGVFTVSVKPISAKRAADLWRLDTAKNYINGEELLGNWTPRGISLVKDYMLARQKRRQLLEIEAAKGILGNRKLSVNRNIRSRTPSPSLPDARQEELLRKYVDLWRKPIPSMSNPIFDTSGTGNGEDGSTRQPHHLSATFSPTKQHVAQTRYVATVAHHPKNPLSFKSGYVLMPSESYSQDHSRTTHMQWKRRFVDLRPPYLHIHSVPDGDAMNAINLTHARIDRDPDFKRLLGSVSADDSPSKNAGLSHVFAVYGEQNTFLFAARNETARSEWLLAIDQSYMGEDGDLSDGGTNGEV